MEDNKFKSKIIKIATILCVSVIFILGFDKVSIIIKTIFSAFVPFIAGGIIALVLNIPVRFIETKLLKQNKGKISKIKRAISIILSIVFFLAIIAGVGIVVVPEITEAISDMSSTVPDAIVEGVELVENNVKLKEDWAVELDGIKKAASSWEGLLNYTMKFLPEGKETISSAVSTIKSVIGSLTNVLIACIFAVYTVAEKEKILAFCQKFVKTFFNDVRKKEIFHFFTTLHKCFEDFVYGQCLECFLVATIFTIIASIMGFKCSIIVGIIMFFLAFIPYVGNVVTCCIGMLLTLAMETPSRAIVICILFCVIQALDGYFLYPRVIGLKVKMPPLLIFVAAIAGGNLFGVVGMFLSIPVATTFYILITEKMDGRKTERVLPPNNTNNIKSNKKKLTNKKGRSK